MHEITKWESSFHKILKLTDLSSQIFAVESHHSAESVLLQADLSWFSWETRNGPIIIIIFRSVSRARRLILRLLLSLLCFQQGSSAISLGHLHANISLSGAWRFLGSRRSFIKIVRRQNTAAYSSMSFSHKTSEPVWSRDRSRMKTPVCSSGRSGINQSGKGHFSSASGETTDSLVVLPR